MSLIKSFICALSLFMIPSLAQCYAEQDSLTEQYLSMVREAQDLLEQHQYGHAAELYMYAFRMKDGVSNNRRLHSAGAWAMAGEVDSAFHQLNILVNQKDYTGINQLIINPYLASLNNDPRYAEVKQSARENRKEQLGPHDTTLLATLDTIQRQDQRLRQLQDLIRYRYGRYSDTFDALWEKQKRLDSINQEKVEEILASDGWPSTEEVGQKGCETIFHVLQHADYHVSWQKQYLPKVRQAAKAGKIDSSEMAMFIDRVKINSGQKQVYGTQIGYYKPTGQHFVKPLKQPMTVEKRRKQVGLPPMDLYLSNWDLEWNPKAYKEKLSYYLKWAESDD